MPQEKVDVKFRRRKAKAFEKPLYPRAKAPGLYGLFRK
jgi:hypothetical protein